MNASYYETKDLEDFPNIGEFAPEEGRRFFEYYGQATEIRKIIKKKEM